MAEPSPPSLPPEPGSAHPGAGPSGALHPPAAVAPPAGRSPRGRRGLAALLAVVAVIAGTALLGAATGFLWAAVAPRALAVVVGRDAANVLNPESSAFIAADGWFTLLTAIGGVVSGLLGYALAVRRFGAAAMAAVLVGAVAATLLAKWIGQSSGVAGYNHSLTVGQSGTLVHVPLALGGNGPLAFWPLAAGLTAGVIELIATMRERRVRSAAWPAYGPPAYGSPADGSSVAPAGPYGYTDGDSRPGPYSPAPDAAPRAASGAGL